MYWRAKKAGTSASDDRIGSDNTRLRTRTSKDRDKSRSRPRPPPPPTGSLEVGQSRRPETRGQGVKRTPLLHCHPREQALSIEERSKKQARNKDKDLSPRFSFAPAPRCSQQQPSGDPAGGGGPSGRRSEVGSRQTCRPELEVERFWGYVRSGSEGYVPPVLPSLLTALLPLPLPPTACLPICFLFSFCVIVVVVAAVAAALEPNFLFLRSGWSACLFSTPQPTKQHPKNNFCRLHFPSGSLQFLSSIYPSIHLSRFPTLPYPLPTIRTLICLPTLSITSTFLVSSLQVACPPGFPSGLWCEALGGPFLPLALAGSWLRLRTPLPTRYRGF